VLRAATGGECIGLLVRRDRDRGHRQARALAQTVHHLVELRRLLAAHELPPVGTQRHLAGIEQHDYAHHRRDRERDQHAALSTDHPANDAEQRDHAGEEHEDLEVGHDDSFPARRPC
jgi:hypothetical protein